jgi:regulation of enolase protein 1 (concanavalin A-like superfamily)
MKKLTVGKRIIPIWLVAVLLLSLIGSTVIGYVAWTTLTIPVEVEEPIKILNYPSKLNLFPGDTKQFTISMKNQADNEYVVFLEFSLDNSDYQSNYVTFSSDYYTILPGQNDIIAWFSVKENAPSMNATLSVQFNRLEALSFTDNFDSSTLDSKWSKIDPAGGSAFDLSANSGWLRMTTTSPPYRDLYKPVAINAPRIMMEGITGNFTIETKIMANTDQEWESAGILIWKDSSNFLRLDRACGMSNSQRIVFIMAKNDGWAPIDVILPSNMNPTYLKLSRLGDKFSAYYSNNGADWTYVGEMTFPVANPVAVGLDVVNVYHDGTFYADFDYFKMSANP